MSRELTTEMSSFFCYMTKVERVYMCHSVCTAFSAALCCCHGLSQTIHFGETFTIVFGSLGLENVVTTASLGSKH